MTWDRDLKELRITSAPLQLSDAEQVVSAASRVGAWRSKCFIRRKVAVGLARTRTFCFTLPRLGVEACGVAVVSPPSPSPFCLKAIQLGNAKVFAIQILKLRWPEAFFLAPLRAARSSSSWAFLCPVPPYIFFGDFFFFFFFFFFFSFLKKAPPQKRGFFFPAVRASVSAIAFPRPHPALALALDGLPVFTPDHRNSIV